MPGAVFRKDRQRLFVLWMMRDPDAQLGVNRRVPAHALPGLDIIRPKKLRMPAGRPSRGPFRSRLKCMPPKILFFVSDYVIVAGVKAQTLERFISEKPFVAVKGIFVRQ